MRPQLTAAVLVLSAVLAGCEHPFQCARKADRVEVTRYVTVVGRVQESEATVTDPDEVERLVALLGERRDIYSHLLSMVDYRLAFVKGGGEDIVITVRGSQWVFEKPEQKEVYVAGDELRAYLLRLFEPMAP